jgi:nucleotide-binding universal stress UspA family protein
MLRAMAETIVAGYNGRGAAAALAKAIGRVQASPGSELVVVVDEYLPVDPGLPSMVYEPFGDTLPLPDPEAPPPPPLAPIIAEAREQVERAGIAARYVWGLGDPARLIVDTARDAGAAAIVVGADHHGFLGRLFGNDVEAEVRREASCEVVVVD